DPAASGHAPAPPARGPRAPTADDDRSSARAGVSPAPARGGVSSAATAAPAPAGPPVGGTCESAGLRKSRSAALSEIGEDRAKTFGARIRSRARRSTGRAAPPNPQVPLP